MAFIQSMQSTHLFLEFVLFFLKNNMYNNNFIIEMLVFVIVKKYTYHFEIFKI